jgi:hypothetical protein
MIKSLITICVLGIAGCGLGTPELNIPYEVNPELQVRNSGDVLYGDELYRWNAHAHYLGYFTTSGRGSYDAKNTLAQIHWEPRAYSSCINETYSNFQTIQGGGNATAFSANLLLPANDRYVLSFDAKVSSFSGTGIGQLSAGIYVRNKITDEYSAILWALFDNRYDDYPPQIQNDTYVNFYTTPVQYVDPYSHMKNKPYDYQHYDIVIDQAMVRKVVPKGDLKDYELYQFDFLHEVFLEKDQNINMCADVKNIKITK